jgi:tetratricopeptide (TPR) repeat protein
MVLRLRPLGESLDARALMARGLFESRRENEAIAEAEAILKADADHYQTRFLLGQIYTSRGDVWRAMLELGRVLRAHPRHRDTLHLMGDIHFRLNAYEAALDCFRRVLDLDRRDSSAWLRVAAIAFATGRNAEAISAFRRASRLDPTLAASGHSLGDYYSLLRTLQPPGRR